MNQFDDVTDFHNKFGLGTTGPAQALEPSEQKFRIKCLYEELAEYETAVSAGDLPEQFDALVDMIYFALGVCHRNRFPVSHGFDRVHQANMTKKLGPNGVEIVKPEGWQPPNLEDLIQNDFYELLKRNAGLVTVDGPDGSGKTSITNELEEILRGTPLSTSRVYMGCWGHDLLPMRFIRRLIPPRISHFRIWQAVRGKPVDLTEDEREFFEKNQPKPLLQGWRALRYACKDTIFYSALMLELGVRFLRGIQRPTPPWTAALSTGRRFHGFHETRCTVPAPPRLPPRRLGSASRFERSWLRCGETAAPCGTP